MKRVVFINICLEDLEDFGIKNQEEKKTPHLLTQKTAPQIQIKDDDDHDDSINEGDELLKRSVLLEKTYKDIEVVDEIIFDEDTRNETLLARKEHGMCLLELNM